MNRQQPHHVIVHNDGEHYQEEHQPNLHEALFERQAHVAPQQPFNSQQQDVPTVQNRNRQQIQDSQVHANQHHQGNDRQRAFFRRLSSRARNPHRPLQLLQRN